MMEAMRLEKEKGKQAPWARGRSIMHEMLLIINHFIVSSQHTRPVHFLLGRFFSP
ncbi:hypothetical protein [Kerstersia gyiorum]|uniref:hypothetical protein n=1 Tax=Kerstersia gyiorum TaxID=206506 RepID=UPI00242CC761|nr:hypothetical protein [Kerstersia gyiorum]MCH4270358.1 hypothetical protein [Kerstersia gyiorum]MCI1228770.1 hypothetical protein [Kerstersia gyiorum]